MADDLADLEKAQEAFDCFSLLEEIIFRSMNPATRFERLKETFREGNIPLYFQFYLMIRNNILLGEIEPGTRIPTIDELNRIFQVSHATIRKALALLEKNRLIIKKRGTGIMVRENVDLLAIEKQTIIKALPTL